MLDPIDATCDKLRILLEAAVKRNLADGILLSGGLDTSILAALASKYMHLEAFTAAFEKAPAPDLKYSKIIANRYNLNHHIKTFDEKELGEMLIAVIQTLKTFDPMEVRNSITIFAGLKAAQDNDIKNLMTGDGCDELFAGYSFLFGLDKKKLNLELQKLWDRMHFSSVDLANSLGLNVKLPFLDPKLKAFAMQINPELKIKTENGQTWGKWILRKAFEKMLPEGIAWREKTPIEVGSGTTILSSMLSATITDKEFEEKKQKYLTEDKVTIRDKEQLVYYEIYRLAIGVPHPENEKDKTCPYCNSNVAEKSTYCRTCGAYPI